MNRRLVVALAPLLLGSACVRVESGTDPEPLGYGPGPAAGLGGGYDTDPVVRPAPTPWRPPTGVFAQGYVPPSMSAPEPVAYNDDIVRVCEHLGAMAKPADPAPERTAQCLADYRVERVFRTIAEWKTLAACLERTSDAAGVDTCERASPRMFGPIVDHPRESEVCMHIFAITVVEQLGAEPMLDAERIAEFEPLQADCVGSLVTEEREDRNPTEYVEMLECIERSRTIAGAEACE